MNEKVRRKGVSREGKNDHYLYYIISVYAALGHREKDKVKQVQDMRRLIYWIQRKKRIKEKRCGQCCLTCPYYKECSGEGG